MSDAPPPPAEPVAPVEGSAELPPRAPPTPAPSPTPAPPTPAELVEGLAVHPKQAQLVAIVRQAAMEACAARRTDFASRLSDGSVRPITTVPDGFTPSDADTP